MKLITSEPALTQKPFPFMSIYSFSILEICCLGLTEQHQPDGTAGMKSNVGMDGWIVIPAGSSVGYRQA
jgi:hypothetical protein